MIKAIPIDEHIDERLREFHKRLSRNEKVVAMSTTEKYLFIRTAYDDDDNHFLSSPKNLLLEEARQKK